MLVYPSSMAVSTAALNLLAEALRARRRQLGTRWRVLPPGRQALHVLAAMAPPLEQAVQVAARKAYVTLDGTQLRTDLVAMAPGNDRPYYSGKHKAHGMNVQVIADPAGRLIGASPTSPGARHDAGAATEHGIPAALAEAGVTAYAGSAYHGVGPTIHPHTAGPATTAPPESSSPALCATGRRP